MFDDSDTNNTDNNQNQMNGVGNLAGSVPTMGLGSNPSASSNSQGQSVPGVITPDDSAQQTQSESSYSSDDYSSDKAQDDNSQEDVNPPDDITDDPSPPAVSDPISDDSADDDLSDIKRQALEQLSPLVHKLDQTPEEKYKTIMMMIQASDNQDLISDAYEAAQKITDEKAKAEALLNIVNEINYFSQKG